MFVLRVSIYIVIPRPLTNFILPLLIQSKRKTYDVDKITPVFSFQYIFSFSGYQESESVIKNIDFTVCLALEVDLNSTTTLSY